MLIKSATTLGIPLDDLAEDIDWRQRQLVAEDGRLVIDGREVGGAKCPAQQ